MVGGVLQLLVYGSELPAVGALIGGILCFELYQIVHTLLGERDVQLRTLRLRRPSGFRPFSLITAHRHAHHYQRSWRAALWPEEWRPHSDRKATVPKPKAPTLKDILDEDARAAELDLLCDVALAKATELSGSPYRTMAEPVFLAGSPRTIVWDVVGPRGLVAICKEWPASMDIDEMASSLAAALHSAR